MRKGYLLVCLFFSTTIFSQSINPFNLDYVDWEVYSCMWWSHPPPDSYNFNHYKLSGDTVYQGQTYKRIMLGVVGVNAPFPGWMPSKPYPQPSSYSFYGFFKQDSVLKRNYLRLPSWSSDSLLMDYNLHVGDTIKGGLYLYAQCPTPNPSPLKVIATDSIVVSGYKFRILYTDSAGGWYCGQNTPGYFLIEGLGHINGVFEYWQNQEYYCHPFENCPGVDTIQFNVGSLSINKFSYKKELEVYPIPAPDKLSLNVASVGTISIHNSMGENILKTKVDLQQKEIDVSKLLPGIYFIEMISEEKRFSAKFIKQ